MRRSLGGFLLIVGGVLIALAIGAWWLQRVAFTPADDSDVALSILGDEDIRGQIATIVASADAPTLQQSPPQLKEFIEEIARIPDGAALMSRFVAEGLMFHMPGRWDLRLEVRAADRTEPLLDTLLLP